MIEVPIELLLLVFLIVIFLGYKGFKYLDGVNLEKERLVRLNRKKLNFHILNKSRKWVDGEIPFHLQPYLEDQPLVASMLGRNLEFRFELTIENVGLDSVFLTRVDVNLIEDTNSVEKLEINPIDIELDDFVEIGVGASKKFKFRVNAGNIDPNEGEVSQEIELIKAKGLRIKAIDKFSDEICSDVIKPKVLSYIEDDF